MVIYNSSLPCLSGQGGNLKCQTLSPPLSPTAWHLYFCDTSCLVQWSGTKRFHLLPAMSTWKFLCVSKSRFCHWERKDGDAKFRVAEKHSWGATRSTWHTFWYIGSFQGVRVTGNQWSLQRLELRSIHLSITVIYISIKRKKWWKLHKKHEVKRMYALGVIEERRKRWRKKQDKSDIWTSKGWWFSKLIKIWRHSYVSSAKHNKIKKFPL